MASLQPIETHDTAGDPRLKRLAPGLAEAPTPVGPRPPDEPHLVFHRSRAYPRAIAWLGFRSFWGHVWHLVASVIASGDIDARDWMHADEPNALLGRVADQLGGAESGESLTERLGRDLWIDFLADSGDCVAVGEAVADMLARAYDVEGETIPRGDILLFGGDTAYPVATELEIHNRVSVPFNKVLRQRRDLTPRVLLGIPGNHDWYDGCDGFSRMFRRRRGKVARSSQVLLDEDLEVDRAGNLLQLVNWVEAFRVGDHITKRPALPLDGYEPVQSASYFALPLAPKLELWGVDRQLREVDYGQRSYFLEQGEDDVGHVVMIADPAYAFMDPFEHGQKSLEAVHVDPQADAPLILTGDTHHYNRMDLPEGGMQVLAGGGGAFLHPARINRRHHEDPAAEFPGPKASLALALQVPWQIGAGRAGFIVHVGIALLYTPIILSFLLSKSIVEGCIVAGVVGFVACAFIGGWRQGRALAIGSLSLVTATFLGVAPWLVEQVLIALGAGQLGTGWQLAIGLCLSVFVGTLAFGAYLMLLTITGLEQHQAFSALAHPGYKHFVRMRVRRDGSGIDGFVFGKVDPLDPNAEIVLVDRFTWNNPRH